MADSVPSTFLNTPRSSVASTICRYMSLPNVNCHQGLPRTLIPSYSSRPYPGSCDRVEPPKVSLGEFMMERIEARHDVGAIRDTTFDGYKRHLLNHVVRKLGGTARTSTFVLWLAKQPAISSFITPTD